MTRDEIAALLPGPELDEIACRAVGIEPAQNSMAVGQASFRGDSLREIAKIPASEWQPVSTDPAAAHRLAMAALESDLGAVAVYPLSSGGFAGTCANKREVRLPDAPGCPNRDTDAEMFFRGPGSEGKTPMHAGALAVAIAGFEETGP